MKYNYQLTNCLFFLPQWYGTIVNRNGQPIEIQYYRGPNGRQPFIEWFESIRDRNTRNRIGQQLKRLEDGNFGDCKSVGDGVFEVRLHFGPGYRMYFGQFDNRIILLLCGGDKASQKRDIGIAKSYLIEYKETRR